MALTAQQYQDEILSDVGQEGNLTLQAKVPIWWEMNAAYGYDLHLRYLHTLRKAVVHLIGHSWESFDWAAGDVQKKESQKVTMLERLLERVEADVRRWESSNRSLGAWGRIEAQSVRDPASPPSSPHLAQHDDPLGWDKRR